MNKRDGQSLMDVLVPFQMLYADGVEQLAAERRSLHSPTYSAQSPHGLQAVQADFFIPFYLCKCAQSPHRVRTESE